jgi:dTDP-4-amino-4,6-dideoxygalactose transaminase
MKIAFLDLKRQYKLIKKEVDGSIKRVLDRQFFILGPELEEFEKIYAEYLGVKYVVGLNSGTDGLILALQAIGVGKGDEVITPVNSFIATTLAITQLGGKPVFIDIDKDTYQIDVNKIESLITKKTKAILPVDLYGAPCRIDAINKIAKKHNLYVIEDACQAHGAEVNGKKTGSLADIGVFSFYPGKNLGAYGDGGAISTDNKALFEKIRKLRNYGQKEKYHHKEIGINSRLDEMQAAVLKVKLKYLDAWNKNRIKLAKIYNQNLKTVKTQKLYDNAKSCYHIFSIESRDRDNLKSYLEKEGIQTLIHYPIPIHLQECYEYLGFKAGSFPVAEAVAKKILSIPMYNELTEKEVLYIASKINEFTEKNSKPR